MRTILTISTLIFMFSCSKDNQEAKKLDGSWKMNKWSWAGKDSIPAKDVTDSLGTWQFTACKSKLETCRGTVAGFFGSSSQGYGWYIRSEGKKFTFEADDVKAGVAQFGGDWDVTTISTNSFIITSESCGSCKVLGKETLTFSK